MRYALPLMLPAALAGLAAPAMAEDVLTVFTYDSFVAEWGPGPEIERRFEAGCACDLRLVSAGDGAALLARLQLEGARTEADIVLGLDTNLIARAEETGLFAPHGVATDRLALPVDWTDETFLPYDYGWFAFVHRDGLDVPGSLAELAASDLSVIVQDPRSSTPGLGLALWLEMAGGDDLRAAMADNVALTTKGWSEAYALFLEGEADMVLSYTTSPAYHLVAEGDAGFAAAPMEEGHYLQVEVAGVVASTDQPVLADAFLSFMVSDGFQDVIPTTNWMYPATGIALPDGFETLHVPERTLFADPADAALPAAAGAAWLDALSR